MISPDILEKLDRIVNHTRQSTKLRNDPEGFVRGKKELDMSAFEEAAGNVSPEDPRSDAEGSDSADGPGDTGDTPPPGAPSS